MLISQTFSIFVLLAQTVHQDIPGFQPWVKFALKLVNMLEELEAMLTYTQVRGHT